MLQKSWCTHSSAPVLTTATLCWQVYQRKPFRGCSMFRTVLPGFSLGQGNQNTSPQSSTPLLLVHKPINTTGPTYLQDLITPHFISRTLRSGNSNLLAVPRTKLTKMGDRAFSSLGPRLWNKLPENIRALDSLTAFKSHLKTHLKSHCSSLPSPKVLVSV